MNPLVNGVPTKEPQIELEYTPQIGIFQFDEDSPPKIVRKKESHVTPVGKLQPKRLFPDELN